MCMIVGREETAVAYGGKWLKHGCKCKSAALHPARRRMPRMQSQESNADRSFGSR
jgi:hypothetical protein